MCYVTSEELRYIKVGPQKVGARSQPMLVPEAITSSDQLQLPATGIHARAALSLCPGNFEELH
jgi:hypothetical protein